MFATTVLAEMALLAYRPLLVRILADVHWVFRVQIVRSLSMHATRIHVKTMAYVCHQFNRMVMNANAYHRTQVLSVPSL